MAIHEMPITDEIEAHDVTGDCPCGPVRAGRRVVHQPIGSNDDGAMSPIIVPAQADDA
jgi:hypothetical protein